MINFFQLDVVKSLRLQHSRSEPLMASKRGLSLLMVINDLSSQLQLHAQARSLDELPIYQLMAQLRQQLSSQDCHAILEALDSLIGPQKDILETASKASSSACSVLISPKNLLESLDAALACCRRKQAYTSEYLIRKLFAAAICLNPTASKEEMQRAIELEMEHLDCVSLFKNMPGNDQEKYDQHLENYLKLLSKFFGFDLPSGELKERFSATLEVLRIGLLNKNDLQILVTEETLEIVTGVIKNNLLPPAHACLLTRTYAFLLSRPEWFFHQNLSEANYFLIKAQKQTGETNLKNKLELQSILLEANSAIQYRKASKQVLTSLLMRIQTLMPALSLSDKIMALLSGASLYECLAMQDSPTQRIESVINTLNLAISEGDKSIQQLDFTALQALAKYRFIFGFYSCLCFQKKEEFEKGLSALSAVLQDFWADERTKQAAVRLIDCLKSVNSLANSDPLNQERFLVLLRLKFMLLGKVHDVFQTHQGSKLSLYFNKKTDAGPVKNEQQIWDLCRHCFSSFFSNSNIKGIQFIVDFYLSFYYAEAEKQSLLNRSYTREISSLPNDMAQMSLSIDPTNAIAKSKDTPLLAFTFVQMDRKILEERALMQLSSSDKNLKDPPLVIEIPQLESFNSICTKVKEVLMADEGNLNCVDMTREWLIAYIGAISNSALIRNMLSTNLHDLDHQERKKIQDLRGKESSLSACCQLCMEAYLIFDRYLPDWSFEESQHLFGRAHQSAAIEIMIAQSNEEKLGNYISTMIPIVNQYYLSVQSQCASEYIVKNAYFHLLIANTSFISIIQEPESKLKLLENSFADFPETWEKIKAEFIHSELEDHHLIFLGLVKAKQLVYIQQVEAGIALFCEMMSLNHKNSSKKKSSQAFRPLSDNFSMQVVSPLINLNKLIRGKNSYSFVGLDKKEEPEEKQVNKREEHLLEQKRIRDHAKQELERREEKQRKKEAKKASSASTSLTSTNEEKTTAPSISTPSSMPKIFISKKVKVKLFDRLWQENGSIEGSWEMKSFRNDIKMRRNEALKLIRALGGSYSPERGHGSHHVAHLPKIEFNGQDVGGLIDLESGELMITLTSDEELKFYQIKQLRNILLKQGFTPDTVALKE